MGKSDGLLGLNTPIFIPSLICKVLKVKALTEEQKSKIKELNSSDELPHKANPRIHSFGLTD